MRDIRPRARSLSTRSTTTNTATTTTPSTHYWQTATFGWGIWAINLIIIGLFWYFMFPSFFHPHGLLTSWILGGFVFLAILLLLTFNDHRSLRRQIGDQTPTPEEATALQKLWQAKWLYIANLVPNAIGLVVLYLHVSEISLLDRWSYAAIAAGLLVIMARYHGRLKQPETRGWLAVDLRAVPQAAAGFGMLLIGQIVVSIMAIGMIWLLGLLRLVVVGPAYLSHRSRNLRATLFAEIGNIVSIAIVTACWFLVA